jgi:hypothetical protein
MLICVNIAKCHDVISASMQSELNDPAFYLGKAAEYCTKAAATTDIAVRDALAAVALEYIAKALRRDAKSSERRNHPRNHKRNHNHKDKAPPKRG